ncbi:MAG TPA: hypothetical protein VHE14_07440 [Solirubrobacteraceae bacterium]|nr:hypothetical protein [Solirubrobacteraceae bacterium]
MIAGAVFVAMLIAGVWSSCALDGRWARLQTQLIRWFVGLAGAGGFGFLLWWLAA